jgi:hypothetical protein
MGKCTKVLDSGAQCRNTAADECEYCKTHCFGECKLKRHIEYRNENKGDESDEDSEEEDDEDSEEEDDEGDESDEDSEEEDDEGDESDEDS